MTPVRADSKVLIYLLRRDLRVSDNPILHHLVKDKNHGFTHLLPLYIFSAKQIEVSGFIAGEEKSPYAEAKSAIGGFWRCGPHRAKFLTESVWGLKEGLDGVGSGLEIRVGLPGEVIGKTLKELQNSDRLKVGAVWMTGEESSEEKDEEGDVKDTCESAGVDFKLWQDEKYLLDDRDLTKLKSPQDLPDVFTNYRKMMEQGGSLRDVPRAALPPIVKDTLPSFPKGLIPEQHSPFKIPGNYEELLLTILKPITNLIKNPPSFPGGAETVHPFQGGEKFAHQRLEHLLGTGAISTYKQTRNGMLGTEFSSKLSAYLAIGCLTARQIHASMRAFEDGTNSAWDAAVGYGKGENDGTQAMRFELLWRDYMRLCTRKYGAKLFHLAGFKQREDAATKWSTPDKPQKGRTREELEDILERFLNGTTGMGLIDASQREIFFTGYTSNRARQNVASFFAKHLYTDWRIGAEWYESMLVDYDVSSNWGNWQYVAGVGNDPRNDLRVFNPVKQSFDYDTHAEYVKTWVQELRALEDPAEAFQCWTVKEEEREAKGLKGLKMCEAPLKKIDFTIGRRVPQLGRGRGISGRGRGFRGGPRGGGSMTAQWQPHGRGGYAGRDYGSTRGHYMGYPVNIPYGTQPRYGGQGALQPGQGGNGGQGQGQGYPTRPRGDFYHGAVVSST